MKMLKLYNFRNETETMNPDEVICSCLDITKGMIEEAVKSGAKTLEDVQEINSVGTI